MAYEDGTFTTAKQNGTARLTLPFSQSASQDPYARIIDRPFVVAPTSFSPRIGTLTSYTNQLLRTNDLTHTAWGKTLSGSGVAPVVTAGFTGPDGGSAWRIQFDRGAGTASSDYSYISQGLVGLTNPHAASRSVWLKSNTGSSQVVAVYGGGGTAETVVTVTSDWQRFTLLSASVAATSDDFGLLYRGNNGGAQTADILVACMQLELASTAGPFVETTTTARTISAPDVDAIANPTATGSDWFAYLVGQTSPEIFGASYYSYSNRYARIPATQYEPASALFVRPELHDIVSGSTYAVTFPDLPGSFLFTARKTVSSVGAITNNTKTVTGTIPNTREARTPNTFGAYTINFKFDGGGASTFSTVASASSIKTSIESGGGSGVCTVVKSETEIALVASGGIFDYVESTDDEIEITGSGSSILIKLRQDTTDYNENTEAPSVTETYTAPVLVRTLTSTSHGGSVGDPVAIWNGGKLVGTTRVIAVTTDTVTISAADSPWNIGSLAATHMQFADTSSTRIANGPVDCSARLVRRFYLPGVTAGITTDADIPAQTIVTRDPITWLDTVVAYLAAPSADTYAVDAISDLTSWQGPIVEKSVLEIQVQDAVKTLAVGA
jgi:hypothetical protein